MLESKGNLFVRVYLQPVDLHGKYHTRQVLVRVVQVSGRRPFYNWKKKYGGMGVPEIKRLKELEAENARLKRMYSDLSEH